VEETGIVIRCMYNNQGWKAPCIKPGEDPECEPCFYPLVQIRAPKRGDEICSGHCWERYICTDYRWGCYPKGNTFARAYKGMKVFFVYKHFAGDYTIWGTTRVVSIDSEPMQTGKDFEDGYKFIHFEPFEQLPREKWVSGLYDKQLVGAGWRQGRFRYINGEQELHLEKLIKGETSEIIQGSVITTPPSSTYITLNIEVTMHINERLEKMADHEGRQKEEIIRESIAEWLKERED